MQQVLCGLSLKAIDSCGYREKFIEFGDSLTMIKPFCNHTQGKRFNFCNCLSSRISIGQNARKIEDLGNPSSVFFFFDFYLHFILSDNKCI